MGETSVFLYGADTCVKKLRSYFQTELYPANIIEKNIEKAIDMLLIMCYYHIVNNKRGDKYE